MSREPSQPLLPATTLRYVHTFTRGHVPTFTRFHGHTFTSGYGAMTVTSPTATATFNVNVSGTLP